MKKQVTAAVLCAFLCLWAGVPALAGAPPAAVPEGFTPIWDRAGLEAMAENPFGQYALMADIDLAAAPWTPLPFYGVFNGGGHVLYNVSITQADPVTAVSVDGNHKEYATVFAAFFSRAEGAVIQDLNLLNIEVNISTAQNCFAAPLVGYAADTRISGCTVSGRVSLYMTERMCGVAGLVGFGYGTAENCAADVTLTLVDGNDTINCEQFLGGVLASGYMDISGCSVRVRGFASVHGYVHNGGLVGMYYVHTADTGHRGYVNGCTVDAVIDFFEHNQSRRAYCSPYIGEQMHWILEQTGNTTLRFESNETKDYSTPLLPEKCLNPVYAESLTPPGCTTFGYTTYTCTVCGYAYTDHYAPPQHSPGPWQTLVRAENGQNGTEARACEVCGVVLEERALVPVAALVLSESSLNLAYRATARLAVQVLPENAEDKRVVFASSDETVAAVDAAGNITALGRGTAIITCTSASGTAKAQCGVTVGYTFGQWLIVILLFGWLWY